MGDGKRLNEIIDAKGTNVRQVAKATGMNASTIYAIIKKDSHIRFDYALRIANELGIEVREICSASPFSGDITEDEIYPSIKDTKGFLDTSRVRSYLMNSMLPLMKLYGKNEMVSVDWLLTSFYKLDDEARFEITKMVEAKLEFHTDPKRAKDVEGIKSW